MVNSYNPYEILGVSEDATQEDIDMAYKDIIAKYHPAFNPGDATAVRITKEAEEAYSKISVVYDLEEESEDFEDISDPEKIILNMHIVTPEEDARIRRIEYKRKWPLRALRWFFRIILSPIYLCLLIILVVISYSRILTNIVGGIFMLGGIILAISSAFGADGLGNTLLDNLLYMAIGAILLLTHGFIVTLLANAVAFMKAHLYS